MPVKYIGPHDAVEVADQVVQRGDVLSADAAIEKSLLNQSDNWAKAPAKKKES